MGKIYITPSVVPKGGYHFKNNKWCDENGNALPDFDENPILVYLGRKELVVKCDIEVETRVREFLKTVDSYFPSLKVFKSWLDDNKFEYEIDTLKAVKI